MPARLQESVLSTRGAVSAYMAPPRRIVLVTGGTGGIGSAICRTMSDAGHIVAATYRNEKKARLWEKEMEDEGYMFCLYKCDVSDFSQCLATAEEIANDLGAVQVLVNNAGITRDSSLRKMTRQQWGEVISNDLDSVFNMSRAFINDMLENRFGRIVNISSINGQKGQFGQTNYAAAKAGMHGFTKALAQEVAKKGVTVNTVSPGYVATDMIMAVAEDIRNQIMGQIPVGRVGTPEDVAHVVSFLAENKSAFITGANIAVNGGHYMD